MPKIKTLLVSASGDVSDKKPHAKSKDTVIWVPPSGLYAIHIQFLDGTSPFAVSEIHGSAGAIVGGVVTNGPHEYFYQVTVVSLTGERIRTQGADPEIIVDPGSNTPPGGRNGGGKAAKKKGGGARKSGGAKKGGKKKAAKKR